MTILIVTDYYPPDRVGGVGTIAHGLAAAYRELGHRVIVLTTGTPHAGEREQGVVRGARRLTWGVLLNNVHALRLIRRERVAFVHLHQAGSTLFLLARPFLRDFPKVVSSLQVSYVGEAREIRPVDVAGKRIVPGLGEYVERWLLAPAHVLLDFIGYAMSDVVTTVSVGNCDELTRTYGRVLPRDVVVVPNGVPLEAAQQASPADHRDPVLEERLRGKVVIAYVGVFRARKRVANLMLAFKEISARNPDAVLLLVGGGRRYERPLAAMAIEIGISGRVVFTGRVPADRVPYYLSVMDVFCLLSSYEGMPMALLEAMHAGKAVVATDCYGMRDLLAAMPGQQAPGGAEHQEAGVLVPVDDVPAAAGAIEALVRDPARRALLGAAAQARVRSRFTWDRIAREYLALAQAT